MGIEPTWPAWKAGALPLSYARIHAASRTDSGIYLTHPNRCELSTHRFRQRAGTRKIAQIPRLVSLKSARNTWLYHTLI